MGMLEKLHAFIQANTPRNPSPPVSPAKVIDKGLFGGAIGRIPANAQSMYQGFLQAPEQIRQLASPKMYQQVRQVMQNPNPQFNKEKGMQMAMDYLQTTNPVGGLLAHTVYHGSPHKFNKFDMSKIGTGEGAQAYGHGLYFAENQDVAQTYATQLARTKFNSLNEAETRAVGGQTQALLNAYQNDGPDAAQSLLDWHIKNLSEIYKYQPDAQNKLALSALRKLKTNNEFAPELASNLYKVDIPDESIPRMLDWEKTLDQQNPEVQAALGKLGINSPWEVVSDTGHALPATYKTAEEANQILAKIGAGTVRQRPGTWRGDSAYKFISDAGPESAALRLKEAGIPGIRYLDGNSRGVGQGTNNYVLFDDQLPRILEVNGQPTGLLSYADEAAKKAKKVKK